MFKPHENVVGCGTAFVCLTALSTPPLTAVFAGLVTAACLDAVGQLTTGVIIAGARFVGGALETAGHGLETVGQTATSAIRGGWNVAQSIPAVTTAIGLGLGGGSIMNLAANAISGSSVATAVLGNPFGAGFAGFVLVCAGFSITQGIFSGKPDQNGLFGKLVGVPMSTVSTFFIASAITAMAAPQAAILVGVSAAGGMAVKEVWPEITGASSNLWQGTFSAVGGTILTAARAADSIFDPVETLFRRLMPWASNEFNNRRLTKMAQKAGESLSTRTT